MENKAAKKYYLIAAIVIIVVIVIIVLLLGGSKSAGQKAPTANNTNNAPLTNTVAVPNIPATVNTTPSAPSTPTVNSTTESSSLIGTWVSSTQGKGMAGSGKIVYQGKNVKIDLTSDVDLVIEKVEKNTGTGKISFNNACLTETISTPGKPDTTKPAQCIGTYSQPAVMQISGNTINYTGKSFLGANISLTGTYGDGSMSGTFTRTSSSGKINGTFDLVRSKN